MFERFTERAHQAMALALDEARTLKHTHVGTEHILLGVLRVEEGLGARVLESLDIGVEVIRAHVVRIVGRGEEVTTAQIPFTPRAKKVLELAVREALSLDHKYVGTEHLLLGIARENESVAVRILLDFDVDAERMRNEILRMLSDRVLPQPSAGAPDVASARALDVAIKVLVEARDAAEEEQRFELAVHLGESLSHLRQLRRGRGS